MHKKRLLILLSIALLILLIIYFKSKPEPPAITPPKVIVSKPHCINMTDYITKTGNTVAYHSVDLVARIKGYLETIEFSDGEFVKKGTPLFVIEPEPYRQQLIEAEAAVAGQKASLAYAQAEYARQQQMYKEDATSLNNMQRWLAKRDEAQAGVVKAIADAEIAAINYSYTHVKAPFDGRVGRHLIDPGNLVGNGVATKLAVIEQISPLYVYFNLNELELIKIRKLARLHGLNYKDISRLSAAVSLQDDTHALETGPLDFVSTGLNSSTGTIEFRALLPNKNYDFLPGMFVNVRVAISKAEPHLTVPNTAILYDQIGSYLLTVNQNNIVLLQRVTIGSLEQGQRGILKGLNAEDRVIIDGLQYATPGKRVIPLLTHPDTIDSSDSHEKMRPKR